MDKHHIPGPVLYRLSIYSRCLKRLLNTEKDTVRSEGLATLANVKPSQLRKDLSYTGQVGTRGIGYSVNNLLKVINDAIGKEELQQVILVGAGNLGRALIRYDGFKKEGFKVIAAFDKNIDLIKKDNLQCPIYHEEKMQEFISKNNIKIAILCLPGEHAQHIANTLIENGIIGILNFSPTVLLVAEEIMVNNVDLAAELVNLSYFIHN